MSRKLKNESENFDEMLLELLRLASHSPSSHNTQPWKVHLESGKGSLVIGYKPERQLTVGDPNKRELYISLGCFIETIALAAEDRGYKTGYTFLDMHPDRVARLTFTSDKVPSSGHWETAIRNRRSDRRFYRSTKLDDEDIKLLSGISYRGAHLLLLEQPEQIGFLSKMTYEATREIMSEQAFRDELARWVRNNWTKKPDGMPGYTQGMPGPISLLAKFVIKKNKKVAIDQAKKDSKRVSKSAALGLICVAEESPATWIEAGRLYQRVCLEAAHRDIKTSAVSAAVISPVSAQKIMKKLTLNQSPVALMRFGHIDKIQKRAPRQAPEAFLY